MSIATKAARRRSRTTTLSGPTYTQPAEEAPASAPAAVANDLRPGLTFRATGLAADAQHQLDVFIDPHTDEPQLASTQIAMFQRVLWALGHHGDTNGQIGTATRTAVREFQDNFNRDASANVAAFRTDPAVGRLTVNGRLDPYTQRALLFFAHRGFDRPIPAPQPVGGAPPRIPTPTVPLRIVGMPRGGTVRVDGVDLTAGGRWETSAQTTYIVNVAQGEHTVTITPPASTGGAPFGTHVTSSVGETITVPSPAPTTPASPSTVPLRILGMPRGGFVMVDGADVTTRGRWEDAGQTVYSVPVAPGVHHVTVSNADDSQAQTLPALTATAAGASITWRPDGGVTAPTSTDLPDPPLGTRSQSQLTRADIERYQRVMTDLGDYRGPFDGLLSAATSAGVHTFQVNFNADTAPRVVAFRNRVGALVVDRVPNLGPQTQRALDFFAAYGHIAQTPVMPTGTGSNPGTNPNTNPGTNPNTNPNTNPGHPSTVTPPLVTVPPTPTPKASSSRWPLVLGVVGVAVAGVTAYAVANRHDIADRAAATRRQMMDAIDGAKVRVRSGAARLSAGARRVRDTATRVGQRIARGRADRPRELGRGAYDVPPSDYEIVEPEGSYPYTSG